MRWLDILKRDPVPWLLDPVNPSARFLTLRYIFGKSEQSLRSEYTYIYEWQVFKDLVHHWDRVNFWGRVHIPYYGGPMGNFGTLHLLAQMGVPRFPEVDPVCEDLLNYGRRIDGSFAPEDSLEAPWLCYTGMALQILWHFGYAEDARVQSAWRALVETILQRPVFLNCPMQGGECQWGLVKALGALLKASPEQRTLEDEAAISVLCQRLLNYAYDFSGREADWLKPTFPRYYNSDIIELCHILAQTPCRLNLRFAELVQRLPKLQTDEGRWCKMRATPVLPIERIFQPSRWLTFEAARALILAYGDNPYG
ncbi:MAG: hypothetical protein JXA33_23330 [Anaerolineae bacterium]|nr:hypothetical protein [Anaerolineae bacterium]